MSNKSHIPSWDVKLMVGGPKNHCVVYTKKIVGVEEYQTFLKDMKALKSESGLWFYLQH